uniref:Ribosomal protein S3 n=1 Tax=Kryptoperidinium foliaceum endosymbiont TaxID=1079369 RepID=I6N5S3_9STRA|nr:ribosomal protein S3 [Kryptoperidinium foliaceum endosymbiont]
MGQKVNPNIFRLGINKKWKTEFFEKKRHELPLYTFKGLEVKSYVERFLEMQGLVLHDYKQQYNNSTLTLYISYSVLPEFILGKKSKTEKLVLTNKLNDSKVIKGEKPASINFTQDSHALLFKTRTPADYYKIKKYLTKHSQKDFKPRMNNSVLDFSQSQKVTGVLSNFFKVLSLFMGNRFNIIINFCCLNKDLGFLKKTQEKNFILLQKFKGTPFLKEGIELLFHVVYAKNSASLLAKFVAMQMKKVKRHKFFLSFLKQTLTVLVNSALSKVKGIKIVIKGRLNGVPRAKHKILTIGDVPVQSVGASIDYAQVTTHNSNGSYGIKVWVVEKSNSSENS